MAGYEYLDEAAQQRIIDEERSVLPSVESLLRAQEEAHFRATVRAKFTGDPVPDPLDRQAVLDARDGQKAQWYDAVAEVIHAELEVTRPVEIKDVVEAEVVVP